MAAQGVTETRRLRGTGVRVISLPANSDEEAFAAYLRKQPDVEFAEPDYLLYPVDTMTPDDPLYSSQWHLPVVGCPEAWGMEGASNEIVLALCDTGVETTHPDLATKLVPGWNVVDDNADTSPVSPHGTWTAGTAAAVANNAIGVASPAFNCQIMPIRVSSRTDGAATISDLSEGVVWAADHGARVASVSYLGGSSFIMAEAGRYLQSRGGVLVMASGNTGTYLSVADSPAMIVVGATTQADQVAAFSTTGSYVDLAAPGSAILTTAPNADYQAVSGTSFSAPLVAGAVALMLSHNPNLTPAQIDTLLKVTADDLGPEGWDPGFGWGRLNAGQATNIVNGMMNGAPDTNPPALGFLQPQIGGPLNGLIGISGGELVEVNALDDGAVAQVSLMSDGLIVGSDAEAPFRFVLNTSSFAAGSQHTLAAEATDAAGNSKTVSTVVTATVGFDATPPTAVFSQPQSQGGLAAVDASSSTLVEIEAQDNIAMASVSLIADDVLVGVVDTSPYTFVWDTSSLAGGSQHRLIATAADQANNWSTVEIIVTVTSSVDTTPPAVSFEQPQAGGQVGKSTREPVLVNASDNVGVGSVKLYADGNLVGVKASAPYRFEWNTSRLAIGSQHTLRVVATDLAGNSSTDSIQVTVFVPDTIPPRVWFRSPSNGERVRNDVRVNVHATDNVAVRRVDLYADTALIASWTRGPYTITWKTKDLPRGAHTLMAEAFDAAGNKASATVTVTIR
jgi:hypothetical protein